MKVYFSTTDSIDLIIKEEIDRAQKEIKVVSYLLPDNCILSALHNFVSKCGSQALFGVFDERTYHKSINHNAKNIFSFNTEIVSSADGCRMHEKFIIIDGKKVITGSFNFHSFGTIDNIIVFDEPDIVAEFAKEFERICCYKTTKNRNDMRGDNVLNVVLTAESKRDISHKTEKLIKSICEFYHKKKYLTEKQFKVLKRITTGGLDDRSSV